jgi:hypothetical protein
MAFCDVKPGLRDIEEDSLFVMGQVFNFGNWSNIKAVLKYYGVNMIKREIIFVPYLKKTALSFLCLVTGLTKEDFLSINESKQNRKTVWEI